MKISKNTFAAAALCLGLPLWSTAANAQASGSLSGTLNAQIVLQAGCTITGAPNAGTSGINLGTLNFGNQPSTIIGAWTANATGGPGGAGPTQITCSPDVASLTVAVSGGTNAGAGGGIGTGTRALTNGTAFLPYEVYSDPARSQAFPLNTGVSVTLAGDGAPVSLPVFGRINKTTANALPAGTYTDTLAVTLSW